MPAVASLARVRGWGEGLKTTRLSVGASFQKIDTLGASRIWITVLDGNELVWVAPKDEGSSDRGIGLVSANGSVRRSEPSDLELQLVGDAQVWVQSTVAPTNISVIHFFDDEPVEMLPSDGLPMRISGWGEKTDISVHALTTSFTKAETLGADRIIVVPRTAAIFNYVSPTDEGSNASGIKLMRDNVNDIRTIPYSLEVELDGGPLWLRGSGAGECTLIHLYD